LYHLYIFPSASIHNSKGSVVETNEQLINLTADIVSAHVANNNVSVNDVAGLVQQVHAALSGLGKAAEAPAPEGRKLAVSVRASVKPDYLVCLECGKKQKTLKRHIQNAHGMTPAEYREAYGLKSDYPMVAPEYSARRGEMARSIGLGRMAKTAAKAVVKKVRGTRKPKADAAPEAGEE
jgi:predicted transcriptional regulator